MYASNKHIQLYIQPDKWMETQSVHCGSSSTRDIFNSVGDLFAAKKDVCDAVDDITDF